MALDCTWLQVAYLCTDGFSLEFYHAFVMQRQILINVMIFFAYALNLPLNTQRPHHRSQRAGKLGLDFGSWQSPDISRSHLYRGTFPWTPPTAIYRAYTVYPFEGVISQRAIMPSKFHKSFFLSDAIIWPIFQSQFILVSLLYPMAIWLLVVIVPYIDTL